MWAGLSIVPMTIAYDQNHDRLCHSLLRTVPDFDTIVPEMKSMRAMMVLYHSPEYYAVKVNNEDKYKIPKFNAK